MGTLGQRQSATDPVSARVPGTTAALPKQSPNLWGKYRTKDALVTVHF
jgi:hypothetical protein